MRNRVLLALALTVALALRAGAQANVADATTAGRSFYRVEVKTFKLAEICAAEG